MSNHFILSCSKCDINSSSFVLIQKYMDCTHTVPTCVCMPQYAAEEAAALLYSSCPILKCILSFLSLLPALLWPYNLPQVPLFAANLWKLRRIKSSCYSTSSSSHNILLRFKGEKLLNTPLLHLAGVFFQKSGGRIPKSQSPSFELLHMMWFKLLLLIYIFSCEQQWKLI